MSLIVECVLSWTLARGFGILRRTPPGVTLAEALPALWPRPPEVPRASYPALVALASLAATLRRRLHPHRLPALRRLDHRTGPQRRGAQPHPVPRRPRPARPLEATGELRRGR